MNKLLPYLSLIILFTCSTDHLTYAQNAKQEIEKSIHKNDMPVEALNILKLFWNDEKKADFYREFDGDSVSYEAKFMHANHLLSIEFNVQGSVQDIEQLIEFDEIPENTGNTINSFLNDQYTKFRITRIQRQFTGKDGELIPAFIKEEFDHLTIRYELEVEAQNKEELGAFEFLFNKNGQLIRKREIVRRSLDNIW